MKEIINFGEIMGRLSPVEHLRLRQCLPGNLNITFSDIGENHMIIMELWQILAVNEEAYWDHIWMRLNITA